MPPFAVKHQDKDEDQQPKEVVGSTDLREQFEDGNIRGSFSLNHIQFINFEAASPAAVVAMINAKNGQTGVNASIDDQGHLVLENSSAKDIHIALGKPFEAPPPVPGVQGSVADEVVNKLKYEGQRERDERDGGPKNDVLDRLGLEATAEDAESAASKPGFETGMSAEEREKAREEGRAPFKKAFGQNQSVEIPSGPTTAASDGGGKLSTGEGRTGTGFGYTDNQDGSAAVPGTPANPGGERKDPTQQTAPRAPYPNAG